jgi:ABC-type uncharacterized transport system substrate-binding protein
MKFPRRKFLHLALSVAALPALPGIGRTQQALMPVIGFLNGASATEYAHLAAAFHRGLGEFGFVEGRNVRFDYRWADGYYDRLPGLAAELAHRQVSVIAAGGVPATLAAKSATSRIPIVFRIGNDPVRVGLVPSLNQPGDNLTGVTTMTGELMPKRLELLHELVPTAKTIAVLVNPTSPNAETQIRDLSAVAGTLGVQVHFLRATTVRDIDGVFPALIERQAGGLVISADAFFNTRSEQLAGLSIRHKVPSIFQYREFVTAGGLMSYGGNISDSYRLAGIYTGRILKGQKVADLPVQQSATVEMIINVKTARAIGLNISRVLLRRANELIE